MNNQQLLGPSRILEMRNCTQQCPLMNNKREGVGIVVSDDADILLGQWHEGRLHGWYVYLSENSQSYGFMDQGNLEGFNVVQVDENLTVCGSFSRNLVNDICLVTTADKYQITRFSKGLKQQILEKGSYNRHTVYEIIKRSYPGQVIGLRKFLSHQLRQSPVSNIAEIEINSMYRYYGFTNPEATQGEGVGMVFKTDVLYNYGTYSSTELNGLGRLYVKDQIHDGIFDGGMLVGPGIKYDYNSNQYSYGMHSQPNSDFERGYGFPTQKIRTMRKECHLRSMQFLNQVVVMDRLVKIRLGDIMPDMKEQREPEEISVYTPSVRSQNRPLERSPSGRTVQSTRPTRYPINESSPLKRMLRQYQKESERLTPERPRRKLEYELARSGTPSKSPTARQRNWEEQDDYRPTKPSGRQQIYQRKEEQYGRQDNEDSMVVKDTFSMIRHMEEIERQKREDLARVYQTRMSRGTRR